MDRGSFAGRLEWFADHACRGQSRLYEFLCARIAQDEGLLGLVAKTPEGQPVPNLIFAAVHYLLLRGTPHRLADFYGSCVEQPLPPDEALPAFREFCRVNEPELLELLSTRRVQTNEVRRSAYLLPAFAAVARRYPGQPLSLIEIGTSAGLLLHWDRYSYDYGTGRVYGDPESLAHIESTLRGSKQPPFSDELPHVVERTGVDLNVVDLNDPDEVLWLRSLIWPEQRHRMALIDAAIAAARSSPAVLIQGDCFDVLPASVAAAAEESIVCVVHSHTLNQFAEERRWEFAELLSAMSRQRPVVRISAEWLHTPSPELRMEQWDEGQAAETHLANVDHHGRWIEWLA